MSDCSLTTFRTQLKTLSCLYDTLYIDSYIFSLLDSAFTAFLGGSCALQIALIIIIISIRALGYDINPNSHASVYGTLVVLHCSLWIMVKNYRITMLSCEFSFNVVTS